MRNKRFFCLLPLAFCLLPTPALAQAAQPAPPPPPPPKHEGTGEFAYVGVSGNASSHTLGLSFETISRPSTWLFRNRVVFVRNEADDTLRAQSFLYNGRTEKKLNERASLFGEYAYFRDRFAGVEHRNTIAGGVSLAVVATERQRLTTDFGIGYLNEARLNADDVSSAIYSAGSKYVAKISDTAEFSEEFLFLGTFDRAEDWRVVNAASVTTRLTQLLSLKVSNIVRYSHAPAPGFKPTDVTTSIALVLKFARQ